MGNIVVIQTSNPSSQPSGFRGSVQSGFKIADSIRVLKLILMSNFFTLSKFLPSGKKDLVALVDVDGDEDSESPALYPHGKEYIVTCEHYSLAISGRWESLEMV